MSPWLRPLLLVVEDAQTRDRYRAMLENARYHVETAEPGAAALARSAAEAIDLVIFSPDRLGVQELDFCRRVRAQQGPIHLPIIVLAPRAGVDAVVKGLLVCVDEFVTPPWKEAGLLDRVQLWLWIRQ